MIEIYTQNAHNMWLATACTKQQIIATSFADTEQKTLNHLLNNLPFNTPFQILQSPSIHAKNTLTLMEAMLEGKDTHYSIINLATDNLPEYTTRVLRAVMQIPLGYISTYGAVAKAVGGGPRAVGNIMAGNIFAPLVPCHRIVKGNFSLGGYGGGLKIKYQLLMKEKRGHIEPKNIQIKDGNILQVYPVETTLKNTSLLQTL